MTGEYVPMGLGAISILLPWPQTSLDFYRPFWLADPETEHVDKKWFDDSSQESSKLGHEFTNNDEF